MLPVMGRWNSPQSSLRAAFGRLVLEEVKGEEKRDRYS
jgi:hypothetical protein